MQHKIVLKRGTEFWQATYSDPNVSRLFGTTTLSTTYHIGTDPHVVFTDLQRAHPNCYVTVRS